MNAPINLMDDEQLDAAVVQAVGFRFQWSDAVPMPSTEWADAGLLVDAYRVNISYMPVCTFNGSGDQYPPDLISAPGRMDNTWHAGTGTGVGIGRTAQQAICRAVLRHLANRAPDGG